MEPVYGFTVKPSGKKEITYDVRQLSGLIHHRLLHRLWP
jgi:hypothetical protein